MVFSKKRYSGLKLLGLLAVMALYSFTQSTNDQAEQVIQRVREKIAQVKGFSANVALELDVDFIRMPTKYATMAYHPPKKADFDSEDFIESNETGIPYETSSFCLGYFIKK